MTPSFQLTWPVVGAATLGIILVITLWWAYSDARAIAAEHVMQEADPATQTALARDAYTYLHLPMIAGIILLAVGLKRMVSQIADPAIGIRFGEPNTTDLAALYGGVLLYLLALLAFQIRTTRQYSRRQFVVLVLLAVAAMVADRLTIFGALLLLACIVSAAMAASVISDRHHRRQLHRKHLQELRELESQESEWRRRRNEGRP